MTKEGKKLNFDFSSLTGKKQPAKKRKSEKPKNKSEGHTGIMLSIPVETGVWSSKDIDECSPEEFLAWTSTVWPVPLGIEPEKLKSPSTRVRIFKQLIREHTYFYIGKGPPKKDTTVN